MNMLKHLIDKRKNLLQNLQRENVQIEEEQVRNIFAEIPQRFIIVLLYGIILGKNFF